MRSKLFVPGARPELFDKAMTGPADAISFDLEDAVLPQAKETARGMLLQYLQAQDRKTAGKTLIVRINAMQTPWYADDVQAVARMGVHLLNLPKVEDESQVARTVELLEAHEAAHGGSPVGLLLNIESPKGLRHAARLAAAHPRIVGLQLGYGDLFEPLGIARRDRANVHAVMYDVRMAAAEAGVFAYDAAFVDIADAQGYREEAAMARSLGFLGKTCIHPAQVALANAVFQPSTQEIAWAVRVLQADAAARSAGLGAHVLEGRMVDAPFVESARQLLDRARVLGLVDAAGVPS